MTVRPSLRVKLPVCEATIVTFGLSAMAVSKPSLRSLAGAEPVVPCSSTTLMGSVPRSSETQAPARSPSRTKSEPMNDTYSDSSAVSTARSVRTTGMSAALASSSTASQPVSTTGENAMTSTPCAM